MACRTLLLKLERAGYIELPPRQGPSVNGFRKSSSTLLPLTIVQVGPKSDDHPLFNCPLAHYHYLGHRTPVGENMGYLLTLRKFQ